MNRNFLASSIVFLLLVTTLSYGKAISEKQDDNKKEAERIWELAIQAKGGREKLIGVRNMIVSSRSKVQYSVFKTYENKVESLYVFPDKEWVWDDNRPSVFGLSMRMYDYTKGLKYHLVLEAIDNSCELVPFEANEILDAQLTKVLPFLLETFWLRPLPEKVIKQFKGNKNLDVIQTSLNNQRIDFAFDEKSHLLKKLTGYYSNSSTHKILTNLYEFSDYNEVGGIMMPHSFRIIGNGGSLEYISYQFNVNYDESIFTTPPSFDAGAEAWKVKAKY